MHVYNTAKCLTLAAQAMAESDFTSREALDATMKELSMEIGVSYRSFMLTCRLAITGVKVKHQLHWLIPTSVTLLLHDQI